MCVEGKEGERVCMCVEGRENVCACAWEGSRENVLSTCQYTCVSDESQAVDGAVDGASGIYAAR